MKYPKILIIGQSFNTYSGGGITLTNLFRGWDKERIAVAGNIISNPDFSVCKNYYQLGSSETKKKFPFNLISFENSEKSGKIYERVSNNSSRVNFEPGNQTKNSDIVNKIKKAYIRMLDYSGLIHYKHRFKVSDEFLNWIKEFDPDIIYSQLSNIELIYLVRDLHKLFDTPIAIHIMDDWPKTISSKGPFRFYWRNKIETKFKELLSSSKIYLSISEAMSSEYKVRYGYDFEPFHNPIDINWWNSKLKNNYELTGAFKILHAGRIGIGIRKSLVDVANAISNLNKKGYKIEFVIQTTNFDPILNRLKEFPFVKINKKVPYSQLPDIFINADLLLLSNDFDDSSITYLKYSMPTKASEYMISGTPILVYSSIQTAVTLHAISYQWAYIVNEKDTDKLESAIQELYKNKELRISLGKTAKEYAINHFDGEKVRERFKNVFIEKLSEERLN